MLPPSHTIQPTYSLFSFKPLLDAFDQIAFPAARTLLVAFQPGLEGGDMKLVHRISKVVLNLHHRLVGWITFGIDCVSNNLFISASLGCSAELPDAAPEAVLTRFVTISIDP